MREKKTTGSKFAANVWALTKIQWLQTKNVLWSLFAFLGLEAVLFYLFDIMAQCLDKTYYNAFFGGGGGFVLVGGGIGLCVRSTSILMNDQISMYPGNARSRLFSRLLVDYGQIVLFTGMAGVAYLFQCAMVKLIALIAPINSHYVFDVRYLGLGLVQMLCYLLLAYNLWTLLYVILTRIGMIWSLVISGAALLLIIWNPFPDFLNRILRFISTNILQTSRLDIFVGITLLIWLLCLLLMIGITVTVREWRKKTRWLLAVILISFYGGSMLWIQFGIDTKGEDEQQERVAERYHRPDFLEVWKQMDIRGMSGEELYALDPAEVACYNKDGGILYGDLFDATGAGLEWEIFSVTEAKENYISFDERQVDENHALLVYYIPDRKWRGEFILRDFAEDMREGLTYDRKEGELLWHMNFQPVVFNCYFGNADRFLGNDFYQTMWVGDVKYDLLDQMKGMVILSDKNMERYSQAME